MDEQQTSPAQQAAEAVNTGRNAAKAAGNAAAGNFLGAAKHIVKDKNLRRALTIVLVICLMLPLIVPMLVGSALVGPVQATGYAGGPD